MKSLRSQNDYVHRKLTYTVEATRRGRRPKIEYDPAVAERAARFGLTVKEYLDALGEPGT